MTSSGRIQVKLVKAALQTCLPGCRWEKKKHLWWIYPPNGDPPGRLPLGEHGRRDRAEIERGHVKSLARQFGVLEKMQESLSALQ